LSTFTEASYRGQLSTFDHMKFMYIYIRYTAMFRLYMGKYQDFVGISFDSITVEGSCLWHRPMFPMSRSNPQTGNLHQWVMFCIWVCLIFHIRVMMSLGWIFYIWSGIEFVWRFHSWLLANQKPWTFQVNNTCLLALARTRGNRNLWPKKHVWFFLILYEPCNFLHKSNVFHEGPLLEPSRSTFLSFISWLACARSLIMTLSNDVISNVLHCLRLRAHNTILDTRVPANTANLMRRWHKKLFVTLPPPPPPPPLQFNVVSNAETTFYNLPWHKVLGQHWVGVAKA
jgi:hypothetical protein